MTSSWGSSWGSAWADSWGAVEEAAATVGGLYRKRGFRRRRIIMPDGTAPIARTETQLRALVAKALRAGQEAEPAAALTPIVVKPAIVRPVAAQIAAEAHVDIDWRQILQAAQARVRAADDDAITAILTAVFA